MKVAIGWQIGLPSGWGTYGVNLAVQLARLGHVPVPLFVPEAPPETWLDPLARRLLTPALEEHAALAHDRAAGVSLDVPYPVLHFLSDGLALSDLTAGVRGQPEIGMVFFEASRIEPANLEASRRFDRIITGSTWNQRLLEEHGVVQARFVAQGIDPSLFHPAPRAGLVPAERFVIFSGGKLEYRKGQDIVIQAFRRFHARHPEALLVTAWYNLWPETLHGLTQSPHALGVPTYADGGKLLIADWLTRLGLPCDAVLDLGLVPNAAMPRFLRECDLAVFPNRCEGGTNLVAMEAMACGVPVVVSANTGHLDLIAGADTVGEPVCWPVLSQADLGRDAQGGVIDPYRLGWGETAVEDLLETMEHAYQDRAGSAARGRAGARFMATWSWEAQVRRLLPYLEPLVF